MRESILVCGKMRIFGVLLSMNARLGRRELVWKRWERRCATVRGPGILTHKANARTGKNGTTSRGNA